MFSQTTEYALRAMACLAYSTDGLISTPELARLTRVPPNYLAKVLQTLATAGLIEGRRGVGGGYRLSRPASEITMLDVINTVSPVHRISSCPLQIKSHSKSLCSLHRRMDQAAAVVIKLYSEISFEDIVRGMDEPVRPLCDINEVRPSAMTLSGQPV